MRLSLNRLHEASCSHMLCERKGGYLNPTRAAQLQFPPVFFFPLLLFPNCFRYIVKTMFTLLLHKVSLPGESGYKAHWRRGQLASNCACNPAQKAPCMLESTNQCPNPGRYLFCYGPNTKNNFFGGGYNFLRWLATF